MGRPGRGGGRGSAVGGAAKEKVDVEVRAESTTGTSVQSFKMKLITPFERMKNAWCLQMDVAVTEAAFMYEGQVLRAEDTPQSLGWDVGQDGYIVQALPRYAAQEAAQPTDEASAEEPAGAAPREAANEDAPAAEQPAAESSLREKLGNLQPSLQQTQRELEQAELTHRELLEQVQRVASRIEALRQRRTEQTRQEESLLAELGKAEGSFTKALLAEEEAGATTSASEGAGQAPDAEPAAAADDEDEALRAALAQAIPADASAGSSEAPLAAAAVVDVEEVEDTAESVPGRARFDVEMKVPEHLVQRVQASVGAPLLPAAPLAFVSQPVAAVAASGGAAVARRPEAAAAPAGAPSLQQPPQAARVGAVTFSYQTAVQPNCVTRMTAPPNWVAPKLEPGNMQGMPNWALVRKAIAAHAAAQARPGAEANGLPMPPAPVRVKQEQQAEPPAPRWRRPTVPWQDISAGAASSSGPARAPARPAAAAVDANPKMVELQLVHGQKRKKVSHPAEVTVATMIRNYGKVVKGADCTDFSDVILCDRKGVELGRDITLGMAADENLAKGGSLPLRLELRLDDW